MHIWLLMMLVLCCESFPFARPNSGIFGGSEVYPSFSYPWMAMVYVRTSQTQAIFCGGTLLDRDTILTAAHCVDMATSPQVVTVQLHRHNRTRSAREENGFVTGIRTMNIHPEWDRNKLLNDYAVLKLEKSSPYDSQIILDDGSASVPGALVRTLGWGRLNEQKMAETLQQANLQIFPSKKCESYLGGFDSRVELCAGTDVGDENICFGDSGGPLFQINGKGVPVLVGVTSFTRDCEAGIPSGFARVSTRKAWIEELMKSQPSSIPTQPQEVGPRSRGLHLFR
ncbi:hypothetical protein K7432_009026 [Basidiobolus ranarum]|uniref:Peptidase S1 domain-containing protein n=1 Tax=Basidiobolus ranarum TaxID=34480 RepID=A0ABR2WQW0_9FUNG